jgi:cobalt-zinc-cadmium efflux system outer membrane protein
MSPTREIAFCIALLALAGCQTPAFAPGGSSAAVVYSGAATPVTMRLPAPARPVAGIDTTTVNFQESIPVPLPTVEPGLDPVSMGDELVLEQFVAAVEARHPSLQAMLAAWQAAAQRYPQEVALDDPMLMAMTAPGSLNSVNTEGAYALELRQKLPWFGKRNARGAAAQQDAAAARHDLEDTRRKLVFVAQSAFFDYYLAFQQLSLNEQNLGLMRQYRETAQAKYRTNQVTQQDVLQSDLELAELDRRGLELQRMLRVAKARINTLLLQFPDAPLPPPAGIAPAPSENDPHLLQQLAIEQRPDLAALARQIEAEQARLALAYKQYYPDAELFGRYDTFWQPASTQGDLRGQVGVSLNLPVYRQKLNAAVCEAQFRVSQRRAEYDQRVADIRYEVHAAYEQVVESRQVVELYSSRLLPVAEQNVAAARANYEVNKATFLDLAQAQRQLVTTRQQHQEALVTLHRRLAELKNAAAW